MPTTLLFPIGFTEKKKKKRPKNWKNGLASHSVKNTRFYPYTQKVCTFKKFVKTKTAPKIRIIYHIS